MYINDLNHPICYLAESEKGVLFDTNTYNVHMFRFISVRKNGNTYYLNFMRFFVTNQKINGILRQYQYDCKLRRRVKYPTISEGQKLSDWGKIVLENSRVEEFYYNPEVIFNESSAEKVSKSFLEFINFCDEKFQ